MKANQRRLAAVSVQQSGAWRRARGCSRAARRRRVSTPIAAAAAAAAGDRRWGGDARGRRRAAYVDRRAARCRRCVAGCK